MKKILLTTLLLLTALAAQAGKILVCDKASEGKATFTLNGRGYKPQIIEENGQKFFRVDGRVALVSDATAKIDPDKYYVVSMKTRSVRNPSRALLGFSPLDVDMKNIESVHVILVKNTLTKLTRPAKPGDTKIYVENGQNWIPGANSPVYGAKEDESDLPNRNVLPTIKKITETDEDFEIELGAPVKVELPAGTLVREHRWGGFVYDVNRALDTQWTVWKSAKPRKGDTIRRGTAFARAVIVCNHGFPNESLDFDELTIEKVDAP